MQESEPVLPDAGKGYQQPDNEGLRSRAIEAEHFFSPEQFADANAWNAQKIIKASQRLNSTLSIYDPKKHGVPLVVAQMATYNYEAIVDAQKGRSRVINGHLDELTESGLIRVLDFNASRLSRLPQIAGLGEYTKLVSRQYGTLIEIRD